MRVININKTATTEETVASVESYLETLSETSEPMTHKSYHEMADVPVVEADALAQLHTNLSLLQDLQGRLAFVMREVRYQLKA